MKILKFDENYEFVFKKQVSQIIQKVTHKKPIMETHKQKETARNKTNKLRQSEQTTIARTQLIKNAQKKMNLHVVLETMT